MAGLMMPISAAEAMILEGRSVGKTGPGTLRQPISSNDCRITAP